MHVQIKLLYVLMQFLPLYSVTYCTSLFSFTVIKMADCEKMCKAMHSSMVCQIAKKESNPRMKNLGELALDIVCDIVYDRIERRPNDAEVFNQMSIINSLMLPKQISEAIITRLDDVIMTYFSLFIEPTIVYNEN